ncbi:MAG: hypothetical protein GQ564_11455 [Bacteroidales bacterium]|nr:hypothetical protein [Bacteroidales bacterium]
MFFRIIKDALKIDIWRTNYIISSPTSEFFKYIPLKKHQNLFTSSIQFIFEFLKSFKYLSFRKSEKSKYLFFSSSKNQTDAIISVKNKIHNSTLYSCKNLGGENYNETVAYLYSFLFFPILIFKLIQANEHQKNCLYKFFNRYWLVYGYYIKARLFIRKINAEIIIVANDHDIKCECFTLAAKAENKKSIYIQHANVSDKFPPLVHDYVFLYGKDSLKKYDQIGKSSSKVFLLGNPKFDKFLKQTSSKLKTKIGIAVNSIDEYSKVLELIDFMQTTFPKYDLILRPHPRDIRFKEYKKLCHLKKIKFSNSQKENSFKFLSNIFILISGESSIHLEAALLNVSSIYASFFADYNLIFDNYGFCKNGLINHVPKDFINLESNIQEIIGSKNNRKENINYYLANINTHFETRAGELIAQTIENINNDSFIKQNFQVCSFYCNTPNTFTISNLQSN